MNDNMTFQLPADLCANEPPESRGSGRDDVRLLVISRDREAVHDSRFSQLPAFLKKSDLLVFNRSRTIPAALKGSDSRSGIKVELRLAEHLSDDSWLALLVCLSQDNKLDGFACGLYEGQVLELPDGLEARVESRDERIFRLWKIRFNKSHDSVLEQIYRSGKPVRYEYVPRSWPIDFYQTIYAGEPGSAEMPSAGRAFTWSMLFELKRLGIKSTSIVLHTGLSSYLDDELDARHPASEEELTIDSEAAEAINRARMSGGRIIAIGTTVVRALETAANSYGMVLPQHGYTRLKIDASHKLKCVSGLITGLHEPEASHLDLLNAFVDRRKLFSAYEHAIELRYLWHEFGDLNLII